MIRLIKGLESIGESSGASLKISVISAEKNAVSKPGISFSAKGTFEQLFKYLYFLENLPYLITINKVSFQREEAGEENTQADSKKTTWFQVGGRYSAYNWKVMKIDFKKIIRYLNPGNVENFGAINPYRDWKAAVIFSAIFLAVVLSADGYVLWKSLHVINENIVLEEQVEVAVINRSSLNKAVEAIKAKEKQFKKPFDMTIADPSL